MIASPINDINLHAWDMNRVKRFIELDIGFRMELCHSCYRGRNMNITFILEKQFVKDCIDFLCKEAQIIGPPKVENGLFMYNVDHKCSYDKVKLRAEGQEDEVPKETEAPPIPPRPPRRSDSDSGTSAKSSERASSEFHVRINNSNGLSSSDSVRRSRCFTTTSVDVTFNREQPGQSTKPFKPAISIPEQWDDYTGSDSWTGDTGMESLFLSDGLLSSKSSAPSSNVGNSQQLPPRTIPRKDHETSIPAEEHPYYNYQPHLFNHQGNKSFDAPYQISSRIIIKDSGEVQFERNVMGNRAHKRHGGFHFKGGIPIPPRGIRANTDLSGRVTCDGAASNSTTPSWQTNFNFQSSAEAQLSGAGMAQFSHKVNASLDMEAPPIPPRPQPNSTSGFSSLSQSTQTSCKSPVPLPRNGGVKKLSVQSEPNMLSEAETLRGDHVASPVRKLRSDSESELDRYFNKHRPRMFDETMSTSTKRVSGLSDMSEMPLPVLPGPSSQFSRSDTRGTLSPSYVDESQFILETSPYYLKLLDINECDDEKCAKRPDDECSSVNFADSAIGSDYVYDDIRAVPKKVASSRSSSSLEHDDKDGDFVDAESIAQIQSTYRQRCTSSTSQDYTQSSSEVALESNSSQQLPTEEVPPIPPRNIKRTHFESNGHGRQEIQTSSNVCVSMSSNQEVRVTCGDFNSAHCASSSQHFSKQIFQPGSSVANREAKTSNDGCVTEACANSKQSLLTEDEERIPEVPPRTFVRKNLQDQGRSSQESSCNSSVHVSIATSKDIEAVSVGTSTSTSLSSSSQDCSQSSQPPSPPLNRSGGSKEVVKLKPVPRPRRCKLGISNVTCSSSDSNLLESVNEAEKKLSRNERQKSTSLCTRFFLDEAGIGVSDL